MAVTNLTMTSTPTTITLGIDSSPLRWTADIQPMLDQGLYDEADLYFQSHIERNPEESISLCLYGYFLHFQRKYEKAERIFLQCLAIDPLNVICLNYYTDLLSAQNRWSDAYKYAREAFQYDNTRAWTIGSYCNVLRHLQRAKEVEGLCEFALRLSGLNDADTWMTLADCCWDLELHPLTRRIFEVALARNPNDFELRDAFSELLIEVKDLQTASVQLRALAEANPDNVTVHTDFGYVLREIGEIVEARKHYDLALKINEEYPGAHNNLGFLLLHDTAEYEKAHYHLMKAVQYDPSFPNPYRHLGDLYRIENPKRDLAASKVFYHKALELRADYEEAVIGLQVVALIEEGVIEKGDKEICRLIVNKDLLIPYQPYLDTLDVVRKTSQITFDCPDGSLETASDHQ